VADDAAANIEGGGAVGRRPLDIVGAAMDVADRGDDLEARDQRALALVGGERRHRRPVDGLSVGD
jgi:hypothetical protein